MAPDDDFDDWEYTTCGRCGDGMLAPPDQIYCDTCSDQLSEED